MRKIQVIVKPPIADEHGMVVGETYEVLDQEQLINRLDGNSVWVMGRAGEAVMLLHHEYIWVPKEVGNELTGTINTPD